MTTDMCIDGTLDAMTVRVSAVRASVAKHVAPVQASLQEVQDAIVVHGVGLVSSSELSIDRLLPVPTKALKDMAEQKDSDQTSLVYRVARLPFVVPLRVTMVVYVRATGAVATVVLFPWQVADVAWEKQNHFAQQVMQSAKPLTDKWPAR